ncbi:MAG: phosphate-starvation-inducible PsiE family protein [Bacteroidales bacterium]
MLPLIKFIERFLIWGVLLVMSVILILAFVDITWEIKEKVLASPTLIIDANGLMDLFSTFLVLLIGLELLETVKAYLKEDIIHVEFIILVAIIAVARKVIVWDFVKFRTQELIALAITITALGVTYFLIKKSHSRAPRRRPYKNQEKAKN